MLNDPQQLPGISFHIKGHTLCVIAELFSGLTNSAASQTADCIFPIWINAKMRSTRIRSECGKPRGGLDFLDLNLTVNFFWIEYYYIHAERDSSDNSWPHRRREVQRRLQRESHRMMKTREGGMMLKNVCSSRNRKAQINYPSATLIYEMQFRRCLSLHLVCVCVCVRENESGWRGGLYDSEKPAQRTVSANG